MKQWKKVVAIALAAVMSLAVLTGCSGGGGSTGLGGYPRDAAKETQLTNYIEKYISTNYSAYSNTLKSTTRVADASAAGLSEGIKTIDLMSEENLDMDKVTAAQNALTKVVWYDLNKRIGSNEYPAGSMLYTMTIAMKFDISRGITEDGVNGLLNSLKDSVVKTFNRVGCAPSEYGVAVTVDGQRIIAVVTLMAVKEPSTSSQK